MGRAQHTECKSVLQVVCCSKCREAVNGHWFYPASIPPYGDPNPWRGRCRNCGSNSFTVGNLHAIDMVRLEKEGWWLLPFMHDLNIKDPFVKGNIFVMGNGRNGSV